MSLVEFSISWCWCCLFRREYQNIICHDTYHGMLCKIHDNHHVVLYQLVDMIRLNKGKSPIASCKCVVLKCSWNVCPHGSKIVIRDTCFAHFDMLNTWWCYKKGHVVLNLSVILFKKLHSLFVEFDCYN